MNDTFFFISLINSSLHPSSSLTHVTSMGRPKQVRKLWGSLKDKISLIKATTLLLSRRRTSTVLRLAVVKVTTHDPSTSPPPDFISDLLLFCQHSSTSDTAVAALLERLHNTKNVFVALKCLVTLHHLLPVDSHHGCSRLLNLSNFTDKSDEDTWQLSLWTRWFADEINQSLFLSSVLGFPLSSSSPALIEQAPRKNISNSALLREFDALVSMIEHLATAPDSLHYQRIEVIYEVMKLAGENYRRTMRELIARLREIEDGERFNRMTDLAMNELVEFLERLEGCKEKLILMFLNKKRHDGVWDAIAEMKAKAKDALRWRDQSRLVVISTPEPAGLGRRWLDVDWNKTLRITAV